MIKTKKQRAIDAYNKGLKAKYAGDWHESLVHNQLADKLRSGDEATLWNLGIAATALRNWDEARRAWRSCGIQVNDGPGEVLMPQMDGCVRLNPKVSGEVVWGTRIDPVRILVANVPLPESERRCDDIILHDGAPEGQRTWKGLDYPVFDELTVWRESKYSTFEVNLHVPSEGAFSRLVEMCKQAKFGIEDWSTLRIICEECSRGNPAEHKCARSSGNGSYGMAAISKEELAEVLSRWVEEENGAEIQGIELRLQALRHQ